MQRRESVLSRSQLDNLVIEQFIFHVILPERRDNPVEPLNEVVLTDSQRIFFTDRLREAAYGTQFVFREDAAHLKDNCQQLLTIPTDYVAISRRIAEDFAGRHRGNMSPGVFVISIAQTLYAENQPVRLVFLAKLDHKLVYRYFLEEVNGGTRARMEEITNTLVEDKSAMQKSALVDVSDTFLWDALSWERQGKPDGDLTDYFRGFLGVRLRETASELTRRTVSAVKQWATAVPQGELTPGEDAQSLRLRAVQYMKDRDTFDTDEFLRTVVRDENEPRKARLCASLRETLANHGIAGQTFRPQHNSLPKKAQRLVYETIEGVKIELSRPKEDCGVAIEQNNGGTTITIRTTRLSVKDES